MAVDSSGNVYGAGLIAGTAAFDFGGGVSATGATASNNVVLVKYDSAGNPQWARTSTGGGNVAYFFSVAVDASGNGYAAGEIDGNSPFSFGSQSVTGSFGAGANVLLVKYDSAGTALWARTVSVGGSNSIFSGVAVDSSGYVYAGGFIVGTAPYTFGTGVSATGINSGGTNGRNAALVKYDVAGNAIWARTVTVGSNDSGFRSVAVDPSGNLCVGGYIEGTGAFTFGPGVSATGTYSGGANAWNAVLVKYN